MTASGRTRLLSKSNPGSFHLHNVWLERGKNLELPVWLRVASFAFARHRANGHAWFFSGELSQLLATVDRNTGEVKDNVNVSRAIRSAVGYGFLHSTSSTRCLVVPAHAVIGGLGSEWEPCSDHPRAG